MPTAKDRPQQIDPTAPPKPAADDAAVVDRNGNAGELEGGDRSPLVALILIGLVVSTAVMVAFIWYRWSGVREPTTAVIMRGDASLAGTQITVSGERTVTATLDASNDYRVPILLDPGEYAVTAQFHGQPLVRARIQVKRFLGLEFDLPAIAKDAVSRGVFTLDSPPSSATQPKR